jgi:hypothetical protein
VETNSLLKNEVITDRLGGRTNMFMDNHFLFQKMVQVGQFLSSPKSGSIFLMDIHFPVQKMVHNGQSFS